MIKWYIFIIFQTYLEVGIFIAIIGVVINMFSPFKEKNLNLKDFISIILYHPWVVYHFIKEWNKIHGRN
jgi:hypothetical protein